MAAATDAYMFWGYFKRSPVPEQRSLTAAEPTPRLGQGFLEDLFSPRSESEVVGRTPRREDEGRRGGEESSEAVKRRPHGSHGE